MPNVTVPGTGPSASAVAAIAAGEAVVVTDDAEREDEGDLVIAAQCVAAASMAFLVRHTSGFVCVALPGDDCDRLRLPPMHHGEGDPVGTALPGAGGSAGEEQ